MSDLEQPRKSTYFFFNTGSRRQKISNTHVSLTLIVIAFSSFVLGYIVIPAIGTLLTTPGSTYAGLFAAAGPLLGLVVLFAMNGKYTGSFRKSMLTLGFRRFPLRTLCWGLFISTAIMLCSGAVTLLWTCIAEKLKWDLGTPPTIKAAMSENIIDVAALLITALLAAPVFEEIFFRRVLYGSLQVFMPAAAAAAAASLAFSAMHISLLQLPGLMLVGCIWQSFYLKSRNLWNSVILHFYNNLIAAGMLLIMRFTEVITV